VPFEAALPFFAAIVPQHRGDCHGLENAEERGTNTLPGFRMSGKYLNEFNSILCAIGAGREWRNAAADEFFSQSKTRTWATCQKPRAILEWATFHNVGCRTVAACIAVRRRGAIGCRI
jgi:hypothetical protein